jgi:predicted alpha/beta hydrolase
MQNTYKKGFIPEKITVTAADGRQLSARWWPGVQSEQYSLILIPAIAAPQIYLQQFASYLAQQGWGVLTFDYRGIGSSQDAHLDTTVTLDDWVNLDLPAAILEVKSRTNAQFLGAIAHSIGGQIFGQSPACKYIDGAIFISAQRGIPSLFKGWARLRINYAYIVFPMLIYLFGYLPISKFTLPQKCPSLALLQWISWGKTGVITDKNGVNIEKRFANYNKKLTVFIISDDIYYASSESVKALTALYKKAMVHYRSIIPQDYGSGMIGHFGFFRRRTSPILWAQVENCLRELSPKA